MAKAKKRAAVGRKPATSKVTIDHLVRSLQNIESWCGAVRDIIGTLPADMVLLVAKEQADAILKKTVIRLQASCPPPLRVVTGCPPPMRVSGYCPPPDPKY